MQPFIDAGVGTLRFEASKCSDKNIIVAFVRASGHARILPESVLPRSRGTYSILPRRRHPSSLHYNFAALER